jgi:hypothetical protein
LRNLDFEKKPAVKPAVSPESPPIVAILNGFKPLYEIGTQASLRGGQLDVHGKSYDHGLTLRLSDHPIGAHPSGSPVLFFDAIG